MNDKNKIFYALPNDDGSVGEFKPFPAVKDIPIMTADVIDEEKTYDWQAVADALNKVSVAIEIRFDKAIKTLIQISKCMGYVCKEIKIACYKNKRATYLALHAKKERTRNKNYKRLEREIKKQMQRKADKIDTKDSYERY